MKQTIMVGVAVVALMSTTVFAQDDKGPSCQDQLKATTMHGNILLNSRDNLERQMASLASENRDLRAQLAAVQKEAEKNEKKKKAKDETDK